MSVGEHLLMFISLISLKKLTIGGCNLDVAIGFFLSPCCKDSFYLLNIICKTLHFLN